MRARSGTSRRSPARPTRSTPGCWRSSAGETWCPSWVPSIEDRALRERLRRRARLVKARTSARNRIFGLLTQFESDLPRPAAKARRDRAPGAPRGAGGLAGLDRRSARAGKGDGPPHRPDRPRAGPDRKGGPAGPALGDDSPGLGPLLSLTFAAEIGEVSRLRGRAN